jgi:hypothetical protein
MKIQSRDVGFVAISFFLGALFCFLLFQSAAHPPRGTPSVTAASVLADARLQADESAIELSKVLGRRVEINLPMREVPVIDPHTGLATPRPRSLDLIDFRYQHDTALKEPR